tara:strand:+ start:582 stop:758 length:177 start_codon:yes stop_codon:yes gene_type:complete
LTTNAFVAMVLAEAIAPVSTADAVAFVAMAVAELLRTIAQQLVDACLVARGLVFGTAL